MDSQKYFPVSASNALAEYYENEFNALVSHVV